MMGILCVLINICFLATFLLSLSWLLRRGCDAIIKTVSIGAKETSRRSYAFVSYVLAPLYNLYLDTRKRELFSIVQNHMREMPGCVLELGVGCGANFEYYPSRMRVDLYGVDSNRNCLKYLQKRLARFHNIKLIRFYNISVEDMRCIPDQSVPCVVSTIVLCSVKDLKLALAEIRRILPPGGKFFFLEHVEAPPGTWLHLSQRLFCGIWSALNDGCKVTQRTGDAIREAGFRRVECATFYATLNPVFWLMKPHICGFAEA